MRLSWRDGLATVLGAVVVAVGLAVTRSWDWPMLGSYRAGILVLAVVGVAACAVGGMSYQAKGPSFTGRFAAISRLLHLGIATVVVIGLIRPSRGAVIVMIGIIAAQWAVATLRHALSRPLPQTASVT